MNENATALPLFLDSLNPAEHQAIRRLFPSVSFPEGSLLFQQGDMADGCYLIESGQVTLITRMPNVGEVPIGMIGPGDIAGESVMLSQTYRIQSARAATPVSALFVDVRHVGIMQSLLNPLHFDALRAFATILARRMQNLTRFPSVNSDLSNPDDRGLLGTGGNSVCLSFDYVPFLRVLPVFKHFSLADINLLVELSKVLEVARGSYLYVAGDASKINFITIRGAAELRYSGQPKGRRINLIGPGRLLDPAELVIGSPRVVECRTREASVILALERRRFERLVLEKHPLAAKLLGAAVYEILVRLTRANLLFATSHVAMSLGLGGG